MPLKKLTGETQATAHQSLVSRRTMVLSFAATSAASLAACSRIEPNDFAASDRVPDNTALWEFAVNVKDYGAVGDGRTDDTSAIQSAIDAADGRPVLLPVGNFAISEALVVPQAGKNSFTLVGTSALRSAISYSGNDAALRIDPSSSPDESTRRQHWRIENLRITRDDPESLSAIGIHANNAFTGSIQHVVISGFNIGLRIDGHDLTDGAGAYYNSFTDLSVARCTTAVYIGNRANSNQFFGGKLMHSEIGMHIARANNISVFGTALESNSAAGLRIAGYGNQFFGCRLENPDAPHDIYFDDSAGGTSGRKNVILSYHSNPNIESRTRWDKARDNIIVWPPEQRSSAVHLPVTSFFPVSGDPILSQRSQTPIWALPNEGEQASTISTTFHVPDGWSRIQPTVIWSGSDESGGSVAWATSVQTLALGANIVESAFASPAVESTEGGKLLSTAFEPVDVTPGELHGIAIRRAQQAEADTYGAAAQVYGVKLEPVL